MQIKAEHINHASRKRVGTWGSAPIVQFETNGGLMVVMALKGAKSEILGAGPHQGVARFIAQKKTKKGITFNDLRKSDYVPEWAFQDILPFYEAYTEALIQRWG